MSPVWVITIVLAPCGFTTAETSTTSERFKDAIKSGANTSMDTRLSVGFTYTVTRRPATSESSLISPSGHRSSGIV